MIDVADSNAVYYYHYDALGSVIALSDSAGDTVQVYEYDVYGQVAASDPDHSNPFLFTGRRYDTETGLYYYRARYYNPTTGRFLQTDPIGYADGMNMYAYCGNNATNATDPSGLAARQWVWLGFVTMDDKQFGEEGRLTFLGNETLSNGTIVKTHRYTFGSLAEWEAWARNHRHLDDKWMRQQAAWKLSGGDEELFWDLQTLQFLNCVNLGYIASANFTTTIVNNSTRQREFGGSASGYVYDAGAKTFTIYWDPSENHVRAKSRRRWHHFHPLVGLAHELGHAEQAAMGTDPSNEVGAAQKENWARYRFNQCVPGQQMWPRPGVSPETRDWHWWNKRMTLDERWTNFLDAGAPVKK